MGMYSKPLLDFLAQGNYFSNDDFLAYMSSNLCCHRLLVNKVMENSFKKKMCGARLEGRSVWNTVPSARISFPRGDFANHYAITRKITITRNCPVERALRRAGSFKDGLPQVALLHNGYKLL